MEKKPEASGKGQKRKHQDESRIEIDSEALGQDTKSKCQDGTKIVFKVPGKAQKMTPQEPPDLELPIEQSSKGQVRKPQGVIGWDCISGL